MWAFCNFRKAARLSLYTFAFVVRSAANSKEIRFKVSLQGLSFGFSVDWVQTHPAIFRLVQIWYLKHAQKSETHLDLSQPSFASATPLTTDVSSRYQEATMGWIRCLFRRHDGPFTVHGIKSETHERCSTPFMSSGSGSHRPLCSSFQRLYVLVAFYSFLFLAWPFVAGSDCSSFIFLTANKLHNSCTGSA